ncbi:AAA family ATPase [Chromobacterium subtsugae]|uniref:AAA family ATPase n=1 Tax=Chromobacterium subtsugae TaxID=251747 RepID=A0ABS7FHA6_9NEIS|nr:MULTISPECIES: AAA family ATPase [Chromobacterium]KUM03574.1 AAA family ATPase [Chromobacterium subtsugae]KZE88364.1 AAA family ATPase [Chromobacterium sp. F49]MBW7568697.1 AAA family ATPase [Chromobacterium subtsugae]MBW8289473.1 AAA family ATPase [Chromobacterium subtsugae]WSE89986.1 AAA family ATPase [Chromobacterium subtsugae]
MKSPSQQAATQVRAGIRTATRGLVGRDQLAELIMLAAVAQEHLLVVGPPGTAKSAVVRRVAQGMGGRYFEYLLGRFTEPSELFGPVDLRKLREGTVETDTAGMLPEADVVFLDEIFLGSTAILNTLLGVLNERRFRRGHTQMRCPLRVCVGAANALPDDPALAAFGDRFLLYNFVEPVADHQLEDLLAGGWQAEDAAPESAMRLADLDTLCAAVKDVRMDAVRPLLADAIRQLRGAGISLSDRRIVKSQRLIAAAAALAGRDEAGEADLWPLLYVLPTQEAQQTARETLRERLAASANPTLASAVETAAVQPLSRVARLLESAEACLADPDGGAAVEALLREIDANFDAASLPETLANARQELAARLTVAA